MGVSRVGHDLVTKEKEILFFPLLPYNKTMLQNFIPKPSRDWEQEEKGTTVDEMTEWHHQLDGCEFDSLEKIDSCEDPLEQEMATYFGILSWEIPWTKEPGRLQSMGLHRGEHD